MSFSLAVRRGLSSWHDFRGRASRSEYWWFVVFQFLVIIATAFVASAVGGTVGKALFVLVVAIPLLLVIPGLALQVRRLHDREHSGWWLLLSFVPAGYLVLLLFMVLPGSPDANRYGPATD